ncbi:MAG TPA: MBL fold metallo-hydrolase [Acidobacteriota bacterium]|jgi:glyoxylase-like metal-dependent hydrolase (beta-lactamase superfamily II)
MKYLVALILFLPLSIFAADYGSVSMKKVADEVYLFNVTPYGDVGMSGNCVAIVSDDSVVLFDSTATPQTATTVLNEIRKVTDKPVKYLVNSHWHWDHWGGNEVFLSAFPDLKIITHEKTLEQLKTVEPKWNDQGLKEGLPAYLKDFQKQIADAKAKNASESEIKNMEELLAADQNFLEQKTSLKKTYPNVTFKESMDIHPAGREIQVLHARAITVGDTYLYLPKEKILVTGDILLSPFPFAVGGTYPNDWIKTLQHFVELQPTLVIPGHGDVQNVDFIRNNIAMFQSVVEYVKEAKSKGLSLEQTQKSVALKNEAFGRKLGITDPEVLQQFKSYFLNVFVARAYRELDTPLSETPD